METRTRIPAANKQKIIKLQQRINDYHAKIAECEAQIEALSTPQVTLREIGAKIKEKGLTRNEVMQMLDKVENR